MNQFRRLASGHYAMLDAHGRCMRIMAVVPEPEPMRPAGYDDDDPIDGIVEPERGECDCHGSGLYYGAGRVENGKFIGMTGTCFRCEGKGWQSPADVKRNDRYDNHYRRIHA